MRDIVVTDDGLYPAPEYFVDIEGGVYFVQGVDGGPIKIGWSKYPPEGSRLRDLQVGSPVELRVIGFVRGASRRLENDLHAEFREDRMHGEWFDRSWFLEVLAARWSAYV